MKPSTFARQWARSLMRVRGGGRHSRAPWACPCAPVTLTRAFPVDMFPTAAKRRRPAGHPGKKQQGKQRRLDRGSDRRQLKAKGRAQVAQAKLGPGGATRTHGRGRAQPPKRAA